MQRYRGVPLTRLIEQCAPPASVDLAAMTCEPLSDLLAKAEESELPEPLLQHVPLLADLLGRRPLDDRALAAPPDASDARRLAALLRDYRVRRGKRRLDEAGRVAAKRAMLKLAPAGIRELFRPL